VRYAAGSWRAGGGRAAPLVPQLVAVGMMVTGDDESGASWALRAAGLPRVS